MVAYGCELKEITQYCDSFTICPSKGLGTPVGSLLVATAIIKRATRWRKMVGGGMRQAGDSGSGRTVYALKHNVARSVRDHDNAALLAAAAKRARRPGAPMKRICRLFALAKLLRRRAWRPFFAERNILINAAPIVRLVTHLDVSREQLPTSSPTGAPFSPLSESNVAQRILVLGASAVIGQHRLALKSARASGAGGGAARVERSEKQRLANVSCHKVDLHCRKNYLRCFATLIPFTIIWYTVWAKAAIYRP